MTIWSHLGQGFKSHGLAGRSKGPAAGLRPRASDRPTPAPRGREKGSMKGSESGWKRARHIHVTWDVYIYINIYIYIIHIHICIVSVL